LFRAQRVCKDWKNTVAASPIIQTKLWLKSQASEPIQPDSFSAENRFLTGPSHTVQSYNYRTALRSNLPLYKGKVACFPLFDRSRLKQIDLTPNHSVSPEYNGLAGFPTLNSFFNFKVQVLNKVQHSWLDM